MRLEMDGKYWLAVIMPCDLDWGGFHGSGKMAFLILVLGLPPTNEEIAFWKVSNVTDGLDVSRLLLDRG